MKLKFKLEESIKIGDFDIFCDPSILNKEGFTFKPGIKRDSKFKIFIKRIFWPAYSLWNRLLVDGFIEVEIGKLIRKYKTENAVFLEVGCGDMRLRRILPKDICYNAFDISFSEFHLRRVLSKRNKPNIALFSATNIPLDSESISLVASAQVIGQILDVEKAVSEIYRVLKPRGILILSIPNGYCNKFRKKGPHPACINNWTLDEFKEFMGQYGLICLEEKMKGHWVSFLSMFTNTSCQLPITSKKEAYNTDFFFVFQK